MLIKITPNTKLSHRPNQHNGVADVGPWSGKAKKIIIKIVGSQYSQYE